MDQMNNLLRNLLMAQRCAQVHHWQVKSFALHLALGELYEMLVDMTDELAEMYMGATGDTVSPEQSDPNHFSQQYPTEFVRQLLDVLNDLRPTVPQDPAIVNKYDELVGKVQRIKYKMEQLK